MQLIHWRCGVLALAAIAPLLTIRSGRAEEIANSVGMKLRLIEAGRFERGEHGTPRGFEKDHTRFNPAGDDHPVHPVVLSRPFYLATTEVTVGQFRQFIEATSYVTTAERGPRGAVGWDPRPLDGQPRSVGTFREDRAFNWRNPGFEQADDHPVVSASYADALAYCAWLSKKEQATYRLPTEAQWEYAARAGTKTWFYFGDVYRGQIHRFANIGNVELERAFPDRVRRQWLVDIERDPADRHVFTAPVGSYQANPWGLHDVYGNVWEWCEDRHLDTAYAAYARPGYQQVRKRAIDPINEQKSTSEGDWRVIRGGSWFNAPIQCRSSVRGVFEAEDAACYVGFRVAREAPAEAIREARDKFEKSEAARATLERLVGPFQERRDGRLTLLPRRDQLADEFFAALAELDEPVDLHVNGQNRLTREQLAGLAKARHLKGLVLTETGSDVTDADFAVFSQHRELELLEILGTPSLSDAVLAHFRSCEQLESLRLQGERITDDGLRTLPALARLKTLHLTGTASEGLILSHFRQSPLERFSCSRLSDDGAVLLAQFAKVRELAIAGSPITGRGLADIARLRGLDQLDVSSCRELADQDFAVVGNLYGLRNLNAAQTAAGDQAAAAFVQLNNLRTLRMGSDRLTDAGARQLCEIVSLDSLTLTSEAATLTDAALADLWRLVNLRYLEVSAPQISGAGFETLGELSRLEWMSLNGPSLGDVALENIGRSRSLRQLFIGHHQLGGPENVSDAGLLHLAGATRLTQFELYRRGTKVTEEGLASLRQRRPELRVNVR